MRDAPINTTTKLLTAAATALVAMGTVSAQAFEPIISLGGEHPVIHPNGATDEILATKEQTDGLFSVITLGGAGGPGPAITHANEAEVWYVLEGTFEFHVGDNVFEGGPGTFVAVDKGQPHGFTNDEEGKLLVMFMPGGYEHFFMDWAEKGIAPGPELGALENTYGVTRP